MSPETRPRTTEEGSTAQGPVHTLRTTCRGCGGRDLHRFLELGAMPLANAFLDSPEEFAGEARYPLDVYFCESCALVQLLDVIDPEVLFGHYLYVTGTSDTMAAHNRDYARTVSGLLGLGADDLVVEVASNDGSLLKEFTALGPQVLGVEPARNIAAMASGAGIRTLSRFFDSAAASEIRQEYGSASAVLANNVLAHVDATQDFLAGCRTLVEPDGMVIVEVPYLRDLVDRLEYDTIYHEHLCYFSVTALLHLYGRVGLSIERVDHVPVHGGSLRVYARAGGSRRHAPEVLALADRESEQGLDTLQRFQRFAEAVAENRTALRRLLEEIQNEGTTLGAYGAPAKGNTLLNYCDIGTDVIPFTVDRSPLKVGKFTPGKHLPVRPVDELVERRPDYTLILAWNFAAEIRRQQEEYETLGGRFIVPIPEPRILNP